MSTPVECSKCPQPSQITRRKNHHVHNSHKVQKKGEREKEGLPQLLQARDEGHVQIQCQRSRKIGCVISNCKLQHGITQPILRLFDISVVDRRRHFMYLKCSGSAMMAMEPGGDGYFTARTLAPLSHRGNNRQFSNMSKNDRNRLQGTFRGGAPKNINEITR